MTLARLAALHGVAPSYSPSPGRTVEAPDAALVAVLAALGVDARTPESVRDALAAREAEDAARLLPPTVVLWAGEPAPAWARELPEGVRLQLATEQGERVDGWRPSRSAPLGVHRLRATAPDGTAADAHLIVAPPRVRTPGERTYGLLVQLYSLLSAKSWGMGDLGDLADLAAWAGRTAGAGFVQVNPLHAAVPRGEGPSDPPRTARRRAASPTRCTCASRTSPSTPICPTPTATVCASCSRRPPGCATASCTRAH